MHLAERLEKDFVIALKAKKTEEMAVRLVDRKSVV